MLKYLIPLTLLTTASFSQANLLSNGSFETGAFVPDGNNTMSLNPGDTTITGWTVVTNGLAWIADPNPFNGIHATDGVKSLDLTSYGDGAPYGGVSQAIATIAGGVYQLQFDLGANQAYGPSSINWSAGSFSGSESLTSLQGQLWSTRSEQFIASSTITTITLSGTATSGSTNYVGLDNVSVTLLQAPVPEPASIALVGVGCAAIARRRKRA